MLALRRTASQSARRFGAAQATCCYSTGMDDHSHSSSSSHDHEHHSGPKNESLGMQLYVTLAVIPICYGTYVLSRNSADGSAPALTTRIVDIYASYKKKWEERNKLHTQALEQAGQDRALFIHSTPSKTIDLRFPETFSTGSPYNVVAGQGANLEKLVEHYGNLNQQADDRMARKLEARAAVEEADSEVNKVAKTQKQ